MRDEPTNRAKGFIEEHDGEPSIRVDQTSNSITVKLAARSTPEFVFLLSIASAMLIGSWWAVLYNPEMWFILPFAIFPSVKFLRCAWPRTETIEVSRNRISFNEYLPLTPWRFNRDAIDFAGDEVSRFLCKARGTGRKIERNALLALFTVIRKQYLYVQLVTGEFVLVSILLESEEIEEIAGQLNAFLSLQKGR